MKEGGLPMKKNSLKDYTLLAPNMAPLHFKMLTALLKAYGYNVVLLDNSAKESLDESLKYVHNDSCYPAMLVIGQMLAELKSGRHDLSKTALLLTQTGGGCRASNYIHLLRKALRKNGLENVPVISLNAAGLDGGNKFDITLPLLKAVVCALLYGDELLILSNKTRPYELNPCDTDRLTECWINKINALFAGKKGYRKKERRQITADMAKDFAKIPVNTHKKAVKVGIVGEIYVKYSAIGNNNLEKFLAEEGCEAVIPGILGFIMYCIDQRLDDSALYGGGALSRPVVKWLMKYFTSIEKEMLSSVAAAGFEPPADFYEMKKKSDGIIGFGCKMGEGWLLTAEMNELLESGVENIVCLQPFGCLPNHVAGKGMVRKLKNIHPRANIVPVDYDPGATAVNQINRIKLMLAVADERLEENSRGEEKAV